MTKRVSVKCLKGTPVATICHEDPVRQSPYDQWRDQFLAHAGQAFEGHRHTKYEVRLAQANARLKQLVGELTVELNTSDELRA